MSQSKPTKTHPKGFTTIGLAIVILLSLPFLSNALVHQQAKDKIYESVEDIPQKDAALILGAAAYGSRLSDILKDRVDAGIDLYEAGKVERLIMSGAENETVAMKDYAVEEGVKAKDIAQDSQGLNTLASIQNLDPENSVIIVSQDYHLPRALFIADHLNIDALGFSASRQPYLKITTFKRREFLAIAWTVLDLWLLEE